MNTLIERLKGNQYSDAQECFEDLIKTLDSIEHVLSEIVKA